MSRPPGPGTRIALFFRRDIWRQEHLRTSSPRGWLYATLRVVSITFTVFRDTKAASRAAALSFSSLLGLGPLVAITVLVAGFALNKNDPRLAANTLSRLIYFIAPQVGQYGKLDTHRSERMRARWQERNASSSDRGASSAPATPPAPSPDPSPAPPPTAPTDAARPSSPPAGTLSPAPVDPAHPDVTLNPRLVRMVNNFIAQGSSGSAGTFGFFSLILIVLLLFKTVEDTFNEIWGVRSGRSILMRIVYYWTILTLGAVLFFASVTLLSAGAFLNVFNEMISDLPFSQQINVALQWSLPAFSFTLLVVLLTLFYRFIPHTRVLWRAAFLGALVVALLLMLNNYLAFLYVRRVILTESLYGSLGFPLVVMFGLYIFWLYVLIGGQISYAVQNVHSRNSQAAWSSLSQTVRERVMLVVLLTICRRFQACLPPLTALELGEIVKVPTQILNECLNRLVDLKLITPVPPPADDSTADVRFQPSRPLNRISLADFKHLDDHFGDQLQGTAIDNVDPLLLQFDRAIEESTRHMFFRQTLDQLFAAYPLTDKSPSLTLTPPPAAS